MRQYYLFLFSAWCVFLRVSPSAQNCYDGAYSVTKPPFNQCAGFRSCEAGYFCFNGIRAPCPAGRYGNTTSLNSSACSGICPSGYYCPLGTIQPTSFVCGNSSFYCPEGSVTPVMVPLGYYSVDLFGSNIVNENIRSAVLPCPFGTYCDEGKKWKCPAGKFGNQIGLSTPACSGVCPEGFYCPEGSTLPHRYPCANDSRVYCPLGSDQPYLVGQGYYSVKSEASIQLAGGYTSQEACPRGSYCIDGTRSFCPAGRYGTNSQSTNASCSGPCRGGYFCPPGSFLSTQVQCDRTDVYCPEGSPQPIPVAVGYYTAGHEGNLTLSATYSLDGNMFQGWARDQQNICEPGFFCEKGVRIPCPPGRYGASHGLSTALCDGFCRAGYYCPLGAKSATQQDCDGANVFCPLGSAAPHRVDLGYYTTGGDGVNNRADQQRCNPGTYCVEGVQSLCRAGFYGHIHGQLSANCSGPCDPGYYCPEGSISPTEVLCGDPSRYCPGNSPHPLPVPWGHYSIGGNVSSRSAYQVAEEGFYAMAGLLYACPAGVFGAVRGLDSPLCSGRCLIPGYFCPVASVSPVMRFCGDDAHYCPAGTTAPVAVDSGFYTADYSLQVCPPGRWRNLSMPLTSFTEGPLPYPAINTFFPLPACQLCPNGTFKSEIGDDLSLCRPCSGQNAVSSPDRIICDCTTIYEDNDAGRTVSHFNIISGSCETFLSAAIVQRFFDARSWVTNTSLTRYQQFPCEPGYFCVAGQRFLCPAGYYGMLNQETNPKCSGLCLEGYYCPPGSVSSRQFACGGPEYICPTGSSQPVPVPAGFYSQEDIDEAHRSIQYSCEPGYYCPGDGKRYLCPAGTYTSEYGTVDARCMGVCDPGYYCEAGSNSSRQFECGSARVYCPRGSAQPLPVHQGFYCSHTGIAAGAVAFWDPNNRTCSVELPCEPGYFCSGGIKQPCRPGSYGWRYGLVETSCSGLCAPGYYCPSYSQPQPQAPSYTVWPGTPQLNATAFPCGNVNYYCPRGSAYPLEVSAGYYSTGGNADNRTRSGQAICPQGSYCVNSISILCPPGRYGSTVGQGLSMCTGGCPAGYYCPSGTVTPIACPYNTYSTGLASRCTSCPSSRTSPMLCQTDASCCTR